MLLTRTGKVRLSRNTSVLAVVVAAACFGTLAVLTTLVYEYGVQPLPLLTWRFAISALLLFGYLALRKPKSILVPVGDLGRYSALALMGYGAASICFFFALKFADASVVAVLLYTYPAMVVLAEAALSQRRLTSARMLAVALTFAGCVLVLDPFTPESAVRPAGVALGLGAAVGYSVFNMLSHRWLPGRSRIVLMAYTFGIASVGIGVITLLTGGSLSTAGWTSEVWLLLGAIVLFPTFLAVVLYLRGIQHLGPSQASILSTFEPIFTILMAAAVLGERFTPVQWAGALLVAGGVVTAEREARPIDDMAVV
jgi:drug/metabolite transporter (DMT)-like permease